MKFAQKLRQRRKELGLTQQEVADLWGISAVNISDWERGKWMPESSRLPALAKKLQVSISELMGEGNPDASFNDGGKLERLYPVLSWVQAGDFNGHADQYQPGQAEEMRACPKDLGENGYILRVKGNSMVAPTGELLSFPEGMYVYVNPDLAATPGRFVIVRRKDSEEATLKRLAIIDGDLYLEALNPAWPSRYLRVMDGDRFCGVVVHAGFDIL